MFATASKKFILKMLSKMPLKPPTHFYDFVFVICARYLLQRGDHAGDGVVKCGIAVEVRLPELRKELEVAVPAPLIDAFANGVRSVARRGYPTGVLSVVVVEITGRMTSPVV